MVKKFFDYIKESDDSGLPYYFSRKLSDFLLEIIANSQDSDVVNFINQILRIESKTDIKSAFTFIDLTDKNDMVSMIQPNRVYSLWKKSETNLEFKDWLSYEKLNQDSKVWTTNRSQMAIGRAFRRISNDAGQNVGDKVIEMFVNTFKSVYDFKWNLDGRFELVEGELIRKWYSKENYASRSGQLGNSCMRYEECSSYFDIYVDNPEVCKLLVLYDKLNKKEISGRALIWTTQSGEIYVDRIYTNKDSDIKLFENYVQKMGWTTKWSYSRSVKLEVWDFTKYPYMDSFCVLDSKSGILISDEDKWPGEGLYLLRQTDGSYKSSDELVFSEYYNEWIDKEDAINLRGDWIRTSDAIYLEYKNEYIHPSEDCNYSNYFGDNILPEDSVFSKMLGDYLLKDESIKIPVGNKKVDGEIEVEFDYLPPTNDEIFEEVVYFDTTDQKTGRTLSEMILKNPMTGVNYLSNGIIYCYKAGDKYLTQNDAKKLNIEISTSDVKEIPVEEYIRESIEKPKISKEDLDRSIMNSDFDFRDHLVYIRGLNDVYYQSFFGINPRLMTFQGVIQKHMTGDILSEKLNRLIKFCLTRWNLRAWEQIQETRRISNFDIQKLYTHLESTSLGEVISFSSIDVFKSFQLSSLIKDKILKDPDHLAAWYYYYHFKQS